MTVADRALQAFDYLTSHAKQRRAVDRVAWATHFDYQTTDRRAIPAIRHSLGAIKHWCLAKNLPPLQVVMLPDGKDFLDHTVQERQKVFDFDWDNAPVPEWAELDAAFREWRGV